MNKTIPPNTPEDVLTDLADPVSSVYLYVGQERDVAWDNARAVTTIIQGHINYLVRERQRVPACGNDCNQVGAVFGFRGRLHKYLTQAEADDFDAVMDAITEARRI